MAVLFFGANLAGMSSRDVAQPIIGAQLQCRLQCLGLASKRGLRSGTWQHRTCSLEVSSFFFFFCFDNCPSSVCSQIHVFSYTWKDTL